MILAPAICQNWLGPSLATFVGIGSTVEVVAMPVPAPEAQLLGPTLIQQPTGAVSGSVVGSHQKSA